MYAYMFSETVICITFHKILKTTRELSGIVSWICPSMVLGVTLNVDILAGEWPDQPRKRLTPNNAEVEERHDPVGRSN